MAEQASDRVRAYAATDSAAAADAAWAAADTLHAAAAALGSRVLRQAADAYNRAAGAPHGRIPAATPAGNSLRRAARLLSAYGYVSSDTMFMPILHAAAPHPGDGIAELTVCALVACCLGDALDAHDEFGDRVVQARHDDT